MMWQGNGCIMYEIFFVNFWVTFFVRSSYIKTLKSYSNLKKTYKPKNFFKIKKLVFSSLDLDLQQHCVTVENI